MSEHTRSDDARRSAQIQRTAGQPVTARGEATLRRILDVAEEVFGERGYYGASISEITRRANVAQGTYYLYFRSKHEIFVRLIEDLGHQLRATIRQASAGAENRLEIERRGFGAFFDFVAEHRRIYRIVQEAERVAPDAAHEYYRRISEGYTRGLREAMNAGEIAQLEPEAITYALMGIGHFVALRWLVWPEFGTDQAPNVPHEISDAILAFIVRGLAPGTGTTGRLPETADESAVL
ncbi:MAG: TetR/AcrR family transcriptional regulator [Ktedonobacterales bacterium]